MSVNENAGCLLGGFVSLFAGATRLVLRGIVWILSLYLAWVIVEPEGLGTGVLFFVLWAIIGVLLEFAVPFSVAIITQTLRRKDRSAQIETVIYSQPNWHDDFQQILAVEVPISTYDLVCQHGSGRLPGMVHTDFLRHRYRRLAEKALVQGQRPQQLVADFLEVTPPADDPEDIVDVIINSEAFHYVMSSRNEGPSASIAPDQQSLRLIYDGTNLEQIVRLLREVYFNSLDAVDEEDTLEPHQTPMAETHLNWMIEAMPNETERLYRENKLKDHLNRVVLRAEEVMDRLATQGLREDEAFEIVTATILASQIPYEEDEDGNSKEREEMRESLRDEILTNILYS